MRKGNEIKTVEELAREVRNEYHRKYRAANPERIKKIQEGYWKRKAEKKMLESLKEGEDK